MIDKKHEEQHRALKKLVAELIDQNRVRVGIEDRWHIEAKIVCGIGQSRGRVEWIPDTYEATIVLCCDLPDALIRWETVHELSELAKYRSGTIIDQFARTVREYGMRELADLFMGQYRVARNQEIEEEVGRYLQNRRPVEVHENG